MKPEEFVQNGAPLPAAWNQALTFQPRLDSDGLTVKLKATFAEKAPPEYFGAPNSLGHADGPIKYRLFGGWSGGGEQVGPDTFRICFDRFSILKGAGGLDGDGFPPWRSPICLHRTTGHCEISLSEHFRPIAKNIVRTDS